MFLTAAPPLPAVAFEWCWVLHRELRCFEMSDNISDRSTRISDTSDLLKRILPSIRVFCCCCCCCTYGTKASMYQLSKMPKSYRLRGIHCKLFLFIGVVFISIRRSKPSPPPPLSTAVGPPATAASLPKPCFQPVSVDRRRRRGGSSLPARVTTPSRSRGTGLSWEFP